MLLKDAIALIELNISQDLRHQDYERVVALAEKYERLITGEDMAPLLQQFVRRETAAEFDQRLRITQAITPAVANSIMTPFNKVTRNKKVTKRLEITNPKQKEAVEKMITDFYGDEADNKGLDYWLQTRFVDLSFLDPNAFLVTEWGAFDYRYEKPKPYPFEVSSKEATNFKYNNNTLKWLIVMNSILYQSKKDMKEGYKWTLYDEDYTITYTQVDKLYVPKDGETLVELSKNTGRKDKQYYIQNIYTPKLGYCPAMRVGYMFDKKTKGRTYVNPFHPSLTYFMKSIKTVSELDLTMALHAFPQKLQYVNPCSGSGTDKCYGGKTMEGSECGVCKGLGFTVHTSAQDALYFALPKDKEDMLPLNDMLVYKGPDINVVSFQKEFVEWLEIKCHRTIFNSDIYVNPNNSVAKTATEKNLEMESIYDALAPFAQRISTLWVFAVYTFAKLADANPEASTIHHSFPADLKMETLATLLEKIKTANDSGAPSFIVEGITNDIAEQMYVDDEIGMLRYKTKKLFYPFSGKRTDEILSLLNGNLISEYNKVLYANYEQVYNLLEIEYGTDFYRWTPQKQNEQIKKIVEQLMADMQGANVDSLNNRMRTMLNQNNPAVN